MTVTRTTIVAALLLSACARGDAGDSPDPLAPAAAVSMAIRNDTNVPIVYFAVGEGSLALVITPRTILPHQYEGRLVAPGETAPVHDVLGYLPDLGTRFYMWHVDEDADRAYYRGVFLVTPLELRRDGGLITYSDEAFRAPPPID